MFETQENETDKNGVISDTTGDIVNTDPIGDKKMLIGIWVAFAIVFLAICIPVYFYSMKGPSRSNVEALNNTAMKIVDKEMGVKGYSFADERTFPMEQSIGQKCRDKEVNFVPMIDNISKNPFLGSVACSRWTNGNSIHSAMIGKVPESK